MARWLVAFALALALAGTAVPTAAQPADDRIEEARKLFEDGIGWVKEHEWGRALEAFERSSALKPHAVTSYNIGACYRAIGRYTQARAHIRHALAQHAAQHSTLPAHLVADSERFVKEIDGLLVRLRLTVEPRDARVAIDGAPLAAEGVAAAKVPRMIAGAQPAGAGRALPAPVVEVLLDPGAHVLLLSRKGFHDVAINRTFSPGQHATLSLKLDRLPAKLRITANHPQARVELDGQLVGLAPLSIERPAGTYQLSVSADDHEPYEAEVDLDPGEELAMRANLVEESPSVLERWWFWTAAGVVVTGAVIGTYFAVRPEPERPPLNGGGLGWTVPLR